MIKNPLRKPKNGNGRSASSIGEQFSNLFESRHLQLWVIAVLMALVLAWLLSPLPGSRIPQYGLGMIASKDIKSDRDFLVEDRAATEQKVTEASREAPSIFEYADYLPELMGNGVREVFALLQTAANEDSPDSEDLHRPHLEEYAGAIFESKVGLAMSSTAIDLLSESGFPEEVADTVIELLARLYDRHFILDERATQIQGSRVAPLYYHGSNPRGDLRALPFEATVTKDQAGEYLASIMTDREDLSESLQALSLAMAQSLLRPNLVFSPAATEQNRRRIVDETKPVFYRVLKDEMIVREGQKITTTDLEKLQALASKQEGHFMGRLSLLAGTFMLVLVLAIILYRTSLQRLHALTGTTKNILFLALVAVIHVILVKAGVFFSEAASLPPMLTDNPYYYAIPFAAAPMLVAVLLGSREAGLLFSIFASFMAVFLFPDRAAFFIYSFCGSAVASYFIVHCKKRSDFFRTGFLAGAVNLVVVLSLALFAGNLLTFQTVPALVMAFTGGLIAGIIVSGTAPLFEHLFGYTTDIKLLELANLNQPVFQEMIMTAPGTYHHSIIVASMVEAAADEIKANSLLAKVGAYYHDIGKMTKPHYYVENQKTWENRHEKLKPSMSSRVIISHVKDGYDLAASLKLGDEIRDIIKQHHGTRLALFFYEKAKKQQDPTQPPILDSDFRYPGPKPQSKEAALVLLADIVEASSRVLKNPTPSRIKALIDTRIRETVDDNQLDESDLTFSDLNKIAECFTRILNGIFHHRIEYHDSQGSEPIHENKSGNARRKQAEKNPPNGSAHRTMASPTTGTPRL